MSDSIILTNGDYTTHIDSNGSKWAGESPDSIDRLVEVLNTYPLNYACFHGRHISKPTLPDDHYWSFFGNFYQLSHVFNIWTNDPAIINRLSAAIRANLHRPDYSSQKGTPIMIHHKLTKKQYTTQSAALRRQIDLLKLRENIITTKAIQPCYHILDTLNNRLYELDQALQDLDRRWQTRHWTPLDWQQWSLISRNID